MREVELSRLQQKYALEEQKMQNNENKLTQQGIVLEKRIARELAKQKLEKAKGNKLDLTKLKNLRAQLKAEGKSTAELDTQISQLEKQSDIDLQAAQQEFDRADKELKAEEDKLAIYEKQGTILDSQTST